MKNSSAASFLVTVFLLFLVTSVASAYDFTDNTLVQEWWKTSQYGSGAGTWTDVIGDANNFNTLGANLSGNIFTIFTNWNPYKDEKPTPTVNTADLFIDCNSDGVFDYAIRLDSTTGVAGVYAISSPLDYDTSQDTFSTQTGFIYGGLYDQAAPSATPVWATGSPTRTTSVVWTLGNGGLDNQVSVDLASLNLSSNWSFVWGTGTCSNDAFSGNVQVPEPSTMLLLGFGLVGLAGVRRKIKK